jgi:hypothetical protein
VAGPHLDTRIRRGRRVANFTVIANGLIDRQDLSAEARLALIYLLSKPDDWELSVADLRRVLGFNGKPCGRNKTYEIVQELKEARFVEATQVIESGRFVGMIYTVFDEPQADQKPDPAAIPGTSPRPENRDTVPRPEFPYPENRDKTKERELPKTELLFEERGRAFEDLWRVYPHKVAKADARRAFEKAIRRAPIETLITGIERYIANKPPTQHFCNLATWLNGERWTDEPPATPTAHRGPIRSRSTDPLFDLCQSELSLEAIEGGARVVVEHRS